MVGNFDVLYHRLLITVHFVHAVQRDPRPDDAIFHRSHFEKLESTLGMACTQVSAARQSVVSKSFHPTADFPDNFLGIGF